MKTYLRSFRRSTILWTFGVVYTLVLAMAVFPPFYLAASGVSTRFGGMPLSVTYWLINFIVLMASLWAFYLVEDIRGELDEKSN